MGGGRYGQPFSRFLWITRFLWRKRQKIHNNYPSFLQFLNVNTNLHCAWTIIKKTNGTTVTSWWHYVCRKTAVLKYISFRTSNKQAPTVLDLQGSYWNWKKRNEVLYRCIQSFWDVETFYEKNDLYFWKHSITRERKWNRKKTLYTFVDQTIILRLI